jgi:YVTN family beta-propeller protein
MRVFLAGRVAVETDEGATDDVHFPGRQGRLLFAFLVLEHDVPVPRDQLAAALWADLPPATWDKALSVLVSKLRAMLSSLGVDGTRALTSSFGCYRLDLPEGCWVDVLAASDAMQLAERALARGDPRQAAAEAAKAEVWLRGTFLPGDVAGWVEDRRHLLTAVRGRAFDVLARANLALGEAGEAARWAEEAIDLEPFHESGYRLLIDAHALAGNRAEGMRVYERCRTLLSEELGAYPSPETEAVHLRLLEAPAPSAASHRARSAVITPAPVIAPATIPVQPDRPPTRRPRVSRWRRLIGGTAAVGLVVGAGVIGVATATRGDGRTAASRPDVPLANTLLAMDASGSESQRVAVGAHPVAVAVADGSLWVASMDEQSVTRVDAATGRVLRSIPLGGVPTALAATGDAVWTSDQTGRIMRIDPEYNRAVTVKQLAAGSAASRGVYWPMVAAFGSVWVVDPDGFVARLDHETGRQTASVEVGEEPTSITSGAGSLWVTNGADGTVTRIDPTTLLARTMPVGHGPAAAAVNSAGVWVANSGDNTVVRIDPQTNAVVASTPVGEGADAILATDRSVWVADGRDGTVVMLDPKSGAATRSLHVGGTPTAVVAAAGLVWVAVAAAPPKPPPAGGVAHLTMQDDLPSLDPALGLTNAPSLLYATCANLLTYPDAAAPAGSQVVPEVAEAVPSPTNGGRTYTFTIRPGFRFSPPSNQPVNAQTFKSTIERVISPRLGSPLADGFSDVVGYREFVSGMPGGLRGVVANGDRLTITLAHPDGALLADLAGGGACAVPTGTPDAAGGLDAIPSAGPYFISSYTPRQQLVLTRNPGYRGGRPHKMDQFVVAIGINGGRALKDIEAGTADYALDGLPREAASRLEAQYGPDSPAARAGHQQYFVSAANASLWLHMNTSRPMFADVNLRRAVNEALDRPSLVAQGRRFAEVNPFNAGWPTTDLLPSMMHGASDLNLYPVAGPDLNKARQLAGHITATAVMYTPNQSPWMEQAQIVRADLAPLGIDVQVMDFPIDDYFVRIERRGEPFDLAISGWANSTTDPAQVLSNFDSSTIQATNNSNLSYVHDPALDRQLHAAAELSGPERDRAYSRLELVVERDVVPVAAIAVDASRDFFSARVGCQLYQPVYGIDLGALCLHG